MKVLICGTGKVARELLKRLGDSWEITVIEKSEDNLKRVKDLFPALAPAALHLGDASSEVVLDEAGVSGHDYVLAMTDDDRVNLAVATLAQEKGIKYILARVNDSENQTSFEELGVKTMMVDSMVAKTICHYLEDPRMSYTSLALGRAEVLDVEVSPHHWLVGRTSSSLNEPNWHLTGILREGELLFPGPKKTIEAGDRLLIMARPDHFDSITRLFDSGHLEFPLAYGRELILALLPHKGKDQTILLDEGRLLAQNSKIRQLTVMCAEDRCHAQDRLQELSQGVEARLESTTEDVWEIIYDICSERNIGLVVIPPLEVPFFQSLVKPKLITLAHSLPCPLFVARGSHPYKRILVPFNASPKAELALEAAIDLARQYQGEVTVAVVQGADFIHGDQDEEWVESILARVREMAHEYKIKMEETVRKGNPVKEIVELAKRFDLVVIGSNTKDAGLFAPHVGELLASRVPCSVLILTA